MGQFRRGRSQLAWMPRKTVASSENRRNFKPDTNVILFDHVTTTRRIVMQGVRAVRDRGPTVKKIITYRESAGKGHRKPRVRGHRARCALVAGYDAGFAHVRGDNLPSMLSLT